jgi:hypothetical protein
MPPLKDFIQTLKDSGGTCHLLGLLSPGGIHSHDHHIQALACNHRFGGRPCGHFMPFWMGEIRRPKAPNNTSTSFLNFNP